MRPRPIPRSEINIAADGKVTLPTLEIPENAFRHYHTERVRFGDTDAAGVVYYATYQRFFEAGRAEMLRAAGLPGSEIFKRGLLLPVIECWARFHKPAHYDDKLEIISWIHEVGPSSVLFGTRVDRGETIIAEAGTRIVVYGRDFRIRRTTLLFEGLDPTDRNG